MNKSLTLHAIWLALAAAAFLFGRSSGISSGASGRDADKNRSGKSSATRTGNYSTTQRADKASERSPSGSNLTGSGVTISQFLSERDPLIANKLFADLILSMDASSARSIFDGLRKNRSDSSDAQMTLFLRAWGQLDGAAAMKAVEELDRDPRRQGQAGIAAMTGWASTDPEGAKAHLKGIDNELVKGVLAQGIVNGLAGSDPGAATAFVLELDQSQREALANSDTEDGQRQWWERSRAYAFDRQLDTIASAQIERGMSNATAWAEQLPEGTIKASAFDRVADQFAREDPAAAADWVESHADKDYAERAVREVAEELGRENPEEAVRWLADLPEANQSRAIYQSMERWTREDPVEAGNFLREMEPSASRDTAVRSYANEIDGSDPQMAAEWAGSIANDEIRTETLNGVAHSWIRKDPEEARAWLPNSGLSAERQSQIIRDADRRQQFRDRSRGGDSP
ncbi:MAG: hypothetical protein CMP31_04535 [Roseibacillus sp.]|jgi:hypothetical protein|nr:hypothetical protein [Roseibacillus sp.]HJM65416.1 hypothetical protein [Roseibacillus sp.]|tara:strand:- start:13183 stop:14553 length:1371 start_codon:yes stop_codon:yes gene_type:complete